MTTQSITATPTQPARRTTGLLRRLALAVVGVASAATMVTTTATPAAAASYITAPANYTCGNANVAVSPPRVWASYRSEQVVWVNVVQRWDSSRRVWYTYARYTNYATFNVYGQNVTGWSMFNTSTGGRFINSRLHLRVYHQGYYRVAAAVTGNQGGATWSGFVGGSGTYCWMP